MGRFTGADKLAEHPDQIDKGPFAYSWNNPIRYNDPDGNCPNCLTALAGAVGGALFGGGVEIARQLINEGRVTDWNAVKGNALQGAITGGTAGLTGGASLLATATVTGTANVVGGMANRYIQGQETTAEDVVLDFVIGGAAGSTGKLAGDMMERAVDALPSAAKGKIGETVTQIRYGAKGYTSRGKAYVKTGGRTPTGRQAKAVYDHDMYNYFTRRSLTVESKFGTSGLTKNQRAARGRVKTPGGLIIDRTTSQDIGNTAKAVTAGGVAGSVGQEK